MKILSEVFTGKVVRLQLERHRLPDGRLADFEIVRHSGGAAVLPVLADGRVLLIRQYRAPLSGMLWEIPAGRLEPGEPPAACVRRELREEAGYLAGRLEKLGEMLTAPGFCDEIVHLYLATSLEPVPRALEADEYIEPLPLPLAEAMAMLRRGEIIDGKTQLALLLYSAGREQEPDPSPARWSE
ncbi:MAG: NUDIX hydrolase [Desulfuromonadales bacterium]|nr:NUDIX hydrolase [Desulfuromonadales bacterium]